MAGGFLLIGLQCLSYFANHSLSYLLSKKPVSCVRWLPRAQPWTGPAREPFSSGLLLRVSPMSYCLVSHTEQANSAWYWTTSTSFYSTPTPISIAPKNPTYFLHKKATIKLREWRPSTYAILEGDRLAICSSFSFLVPGPGSWYKLMKYGQARCHFECKSNWGVQCYV